MAKHSKGTVRVGVTSTGKVRVTKPAKGVTSKIVKLLTGK